MLLFEIRSLSRDNFDEDIISEIIESTINNKYAYWEACSIARHYANENNCYASVVAHNKDDYLGSAFVCFYAAPYHTKSFANAHRDALDFYISDWRKGY